MDEEELRELQEERGQLRQLIESQGWHWFVNLANAIFDDTFEHKVITKPSGMDEVVQKVYDLGECAGVRRVTNIPAARLEVVEAEIKELEEKLGLERDDA